MVFKKILPLVLLVTALFAPIPALATYCVNDSYSCVITAPGVTCKNNATFGTKETCDAAAKAMEPTNGADGKGVLPTQGNVVKLINPIGGTSTTPQGQMNLPILLGTIIKNTLGILGTAALAVFVYAGFQWVTAAGNSEKVSAGASAMLWSAIGICIIFSSYAILRLIFETLLGPGALSSNPTQPNGPACYCTVDGVADTVMTKADGFNEELDCKNVEGKEFTSSKSGKNIKNCTWK